MKTKNSKERLCSTESDLKSLSGEMGDTLRLRRSSE